MIWTSFAFFAHLVARVSLKSTYALHISVLGYSILPIIPVAVIILIFRPPVWFASLAQLAVVAWASLSAFISYQDLLVARDFSSVSKLRSYVVS